MGGLEGQQRGTWRFPGTLRLKGHVARGRPSGDPSLACGPQSAPAGGRPSPPSLESVILGFRDKASPDVFERHSSCTMTLWAGEVTAAPRAPAQRLGLAVRCLGASLLLPPFPPRPGLLGRAGGTPPCAEETARPWA